PGMLFVKGCQLFRCNSRPWTRFTDWCGLRCGIDNQSKPRTSEDRGYSARIHLAGMRTDNCVWSVTSMVARVRADSSPWARVPNWRCVALEKLSRVKLLQDAWHTAPNHSRPGSRVSKPDMDVEDYPEPDPQKGH